MRRLFLNHQLRKNGASSNEAKELSELAKSLSTATPSLSPDVKKQIAEDIGFKVPKTKARFTYALSGSFLVLMVLTIFAQSAQPGSVLYALKRGSEEVRVILQPGFGEDDVEKRRDDERKKSEGQSVENHDQVDDNGSDDSEAEDETEDRLKETEDTEDERQDELEDARKTQEDLGENREDVDEIEPQSDDDAEESEDDD